MARTPPPSRRVSVHRKQPSAGPSKPRKTRVPSKQITPGPSNVTNLRSQPRRSSRLSTPVPSDLALAIPKAPTRLDKGKARMQDVSEMAMDIEPVGPDKVAENAPQSIQHVDKGKNRMMVDDVVENIRALHVSGPPISPVNVLQLVPYARIDPKPTTPLRRERRIGIPQANAEVVPLVETRQNEKGKEPERQHPPFDFKPLLCNPPLLVPQEVETPGYFDAEKRLEAARVRNAMAVYRMRNLEGIIPLRNWDTERIVSCKFCGGLSIRCDLMHTRGPAYIFCNWQAVQTCPYSKARLGPSVYLRTFEYIVVSP